MNQKNSKSFFKPIRLFLYRLEDILLIGLLLIIIILAVTQILLRNLFETGIVWGDVLLRILVLWIGLAGAMVATRKGEHISIDVITRYLPERLGRAAGAITDLFAGTICSVAAYFSLKFVMVEFEDGVNAFAGVPAWVCESIIPFALATIALRYFILFFINLSKVFKSSS